MMVDTPPTKIALLQMTSGISPETNLAAIESAIAEASGKGAVMLFTPEMAALLDRDGKRAAAHMTLEQDSPWIKRLCEAAVRNNIWLHLGSAPFASERSDRKVNRALVIDNEGQVRTRYDKMHLFDVDLPTGESWRESASFDAGEEAVVVATPWFNLGLSICYDLRFPDLYRALSNAGANVLAIPAAFTVPTGTAHWHTLMRARAIEAASYVVAAAQVGNHEDGRATYGHSLVVDPWGHVILDMKDTPGLGFAEIDSRVITEIRAKLPAIKHRRDISNAQVV